MPIIIFKPSHNCNLTCKFCYDRFKKQEDCSLMPVETAIKILWKAISELSEFGPVHIICHGGEPLLPGVEYYRQIFEEFEGQNVEWSMQSNCALLNSDWAELLRKYRVHIGASWDGNFDVDNGSHCWDYILKMLQYTEDRDVLYTITPENMQSIIPAYLFAQSQGINLKFSYAFGENYQPEVYKEMALYTAQLFDYLCIQPTAQLERPFDNFKSWLLNLPATLCEYIMCGKNWVGIQANGDVTHCGRPWNSSFVLGNALDDNFHFNTLEQNKVVQKITEAKNQQFEACKKCKYLWHCNNGCPSCVINNDDQKFIFNQAHCDYQKMLFDACVQILKSHLINKTLANQELIDAVNQTQRMEFIEWRNYMSPITFK